jgi:hypothetical protein
MKNITILIVILTFLSCKGGIIDQKGINIVHPTGVLSKKSTPIDTTDINQGVILLKRNCFICHMEKPDPAKRDQMIAPPMVRIQQHYKPSHPTKEAFVKAVINYVNNPDKNHTLMPGAVKKFNLMPAITYDSSDLRLIAETLYYYDFNVNAGGMGHGGMGMKQGKGKTGYAGGMSMHHELTLDNGKKWKLNPETMSKITDISSKISNFSSNNLEAYRKLGKDIFDVARSVLLDTEHEDKAYTQLQYFFHDIENSMHALMASPSVEVGKKQLEVLKKKFNKFNTFFE